MSTTPAPSAASAAAPPTSPTYGQSSPEHRRTAIRRTYTPSTFKVIRRGSYRHALGWVDRSPEKKEMPSFTPDYLFLCVGALDQPRVPLVPGKWHVVELDGAMFVRDGVALVSPTAALLEVAEVDLPAHIVTPGFPIATSMRIKVRGGEPLDILPTMLHVGLFA